MKDPANCRGPVLLSLGLLLAFGCCAAKAQQPEPIASVAADSVSLRGVLSIEHGRASVANNGEIIGGPQTSEISLERGGLLELCASTILHIARDAAPAAGAKAGDAGLMFSLERGAIEAAYTPTAFSDVVLTPDLRVLISGPGTVNLKMRVNQQGDTCVDNAGENAPYVVASSLLSGGAYRVRPGQRVLFVHGSLDQVVDNEREPCGCPPSVPQQVAGAKTGGPSSTPADTAFPTAVSEGLQPAPALPGTPVVPAGTAHAQVTATLSSSTPPGPPPSPAAASPSASPGKPPAAHTGFFHAIGRFFARVFGAG